MTGLIRPVFEFIMLPASSTKIGSSNEHASVDNIVYEIFSSTQGPVTLVNDPIRLEFELNRNFTPVLDTCQFGKDPIKMTEKSWKHHLPIKSEWELLVAMTTKVLIRSVPKI